MLKCVTMDYGVLCAALAGTHLMQLSCVGNWVSLALVCCLNYRMSNFMFIMRLKL